MYRQLTINHPGIGLTVAQSIPSEGHYLTGANICTVDTNFLSPSTIPAQFYGFIVLASADTPTNPPLLTLAYGPIGGLANLGWNGRIFLDPSVLIQFAVHSSANIRFLCTLWTER